METPLPAEQVARVDILAEQPAERAGQVPRVEAPPAQPAEQVARVEAAPAQPAEQVAHVETPPAQRDKQVALAEALAERRTEQAPVEASSAEPSEQVVGVDATEKVARVDALAEQPTARAEGPAPARMKASPAQPAKQIAVELGAREDENTKAPVTVAGRMPNVAALPKGGAALHLLVPRREPLIAPVTSGMPAATRSNMTWQSLGSTMASTSNVGEPNRSMPADTRDRKHEMKIPKKRWTVAKRQVYAPFRQAHNHARVRQATRCWGFCFVHRSRISEKSGQAKCCYQDRRE